jgi:hypothetical protein
LKELLEDLVNEDPNDDLFDDNFPLVIFELLIWEKNSVETQPDVPETLVTHLLLLLRFILHQVDLEHFVQGRNEVVVHTRAYVNQGRK